MTLIKLDKNFFYNLLKLSDSLAVCEKLDIGLREQKFFQDKELFFKNFDYNKNFKNEIEDLKKICSQFGNTVQAIQRRSKKSFFQGKCL